MKKADAARLNALTAVLRKHAAKAPALRTVTEYRAEIKAERLIRERYIVRVIASALGRIPDDWDDARAAQGILNALVTCNVVVQGPPKSKRILA